MKWIFPSNNGGEVDGFNNASIDTFNGTKLFSVVRETIQNSMDARLDKDKPVRVSFTLSDIEQVKAVGINELVPFLQTESHNLCALAHSILKLARNRIPMSLSHHM